MPTVLPVDLLNQLLKLPAETEVVEFKEAKNTYDFAKLGKYFSALSNEANLRGMDAAWLVFGVDDKKHVVGTQFRPRRADLDSLKGEIAKKTSNGITFREIYEVEVSSQRVLIFEIPPALPGNPTTWEGHDYGRDGEELAALNPDKAERIRRQALDNRFEQEIALPGQSVEDVFRLLDYSAAFRMLQATVPATRNGLLDKLEQEKLIRPQGGAYDITNLGALLFAHDLNQFDRLASKVVRLIFYAGPNRARNSREAPTLRGYALEFESLVHTISNQLPGNEEVRKVLRETTPPLYPETALSELIANALIHQDFRISGGPKVEVFDNRIEITNSGAPLIDPRRFIDHPPRSRNEVLAGMMRRLNIGDVRGSGIDKVIEACELNQLPPPRFDTGEDWTRVVLFSPREFVQMDKADKVRACFQHACLKFESGSMMTNESLRERLDIAEANYPTASLIIKNTIEAGLIKPADPSNKSRRQAKYLPYWA